MAEAILTPSVANINNRTVICTNNKTIEILFTNDLLENIKILIKYIITQKRRKLRKMKNNQKQKNKWEMKRFGTDVLLVIFGTMVVVEIFELSQFSNQINLLALIFTLTVLIWYTNETMLIRKETVKQTELKIMPVMVLYIRNVGVITDQVKKISIRDNYALTFQNNNAIVPSGFYIALRNMGDGPAFNVNIESENFKAQRYQTRFFAPKKDEHAVKIIEKPNNKIRDISKLNDETFSVKCCSVLDKQYEYQYKIKNIEDKVVEFVKVL